jgi:glycosyltransferase involved in cell wall biosynthesis
MKILALEPYYGGSHRAFMDGWSQRSRHDWTIIGLEPYHWKWRMRHSAVTMVERFRDLGLPPDSFDLLFVSDMLNLAEFRGLCPESLSTMPSVIYFHENQFTYPVQNEDERDLHFGFTNFTSALAANRVWFNSAFHRDEFLAASRAMILRMPDHRPLKQLEMIAERSRIFPQGISPTSQRSQKERDSLPTILWTARWEFDKNPELFFEAMKILKQRGVRFRLNVIGEQFGTVPDMFGSARSAFAGQIGRWGYQENRADYEAALVESDIVVSTAIHEFFGVAVAEAVDAGAYPLLPNRLAYPELLKLSDHAANGAYFYDGNLESLVKRLGELISLFGDGSLWDAGAPARTAVSRFRWENLVDRFDSELELLLPGRN